MKIAALVNNNQTIYLHLDSHYCKRAVVVNLIGCRALFVQIQLIVLLLPDSFTESFLISLMLLFNYILFTVPILIYNISFVVEQITNFECMLLLEQSSCMMHTLSCEVMNAKQSANMSIDVAVTRITVPVPHPVPVAQRAPQ